MNLLKTLYINNFFFYALLGIIALFVCAFLFPVLYNAVWYLLYMLLTLLVLDILILFLANNGIAASRHTPEKLSNGDQNPIQVQLKNYYTFPIWVKIIDEIPFQFQVRNFEIRRKIEASSQESVQ